MSGTNSTAARRRRNAPENYPPDDRHQYQQADDGTGNGGGDESDAHDEYDRYCERQGAQGNLSSEFGFLMKVACVITLMVFVLVIYQTASLIADGDGNGNGNGKAEDPAATSAKVRRLVPRDPLRAAAPPTPPAIEMHVVFSTDCGDFQHWQSYLFFYSALRVGQHKLGYVTRIASGCDDDEEAKVRAWHDLHVSRAMSEKFTVHFTPHFSSVAQDGEKEGKQYLFFNKPFGLKHWMEHGEGMGVDAATGKYADDDGRVVALLDPDMVLLRPITHDFSDLDSQIVSKPATDPKTRKFKVERGSPFGQQYGFGSGWKNLDLAKITGSETSPAVLTSRADASKHYAVGPPYIAVAPDMHEIAVNWAKFAPGVHEQLPDLMAEMFAYCTAASHVGLPHQRIDHGMVSAPGSRGEGWAFVQQLADGDLGVCGGGPPTVSDRLPLTLHYCQRYFVGDYFFSKRKMPTDVFSCGSEMMEVPPPDLPTELFEKRPPGKDAIKKVLSKNLAVQNAFAICTLTTTINEAATYFKNHDPECRADSMNTAKTMNLWKLFK